MLTVGWLRIAYAGREPAADLAKSEAACRKAGNHGADIALFPEPVDQHGTPTPGRNAEP